MPGRSRTILTATFGPARGLARGPVLGLALTALGAQAALAFDSSAAPRQLTTASQGSWSASAGRIGYVSPDASATARPAGSAGATGSAAGGRTVGNVAWSEDGPIGFSEDRGDRGPTAVEVKEALGVYHKDPDERMSRELVLEPLADMGVVFGVKLTW